MYTKNLDNFETNVIIYLRYAKYIETREFIQNFQNQLAHFEIKLYLIKCKILTIKNRIKCKRRKPTKQG